MTPSHDGARVRGRRLVPRRKLNPWPVISLALLIFGLLAWCVVATIAAVDLLVDILRWIGG
jgi:hypothetical protein